MTAADVSHAMSPSLRELLERCAVARASVIEHPLYARLTGLPELRVFMEHHVFAVWDFMCLLKSLQRLLTCTDAVWRPVGDPEARRLVNEIVIAEESDIVVGRVLSHFELYLDAMEEVGADTRPVRALVRAVERGLPVSVALAEAQAPPASCTFVLATMQLIARGRAHEIAAAFTLGRERAVPPMFRELVASIEGGGMRVDMLCTYLERHIDVDEHEHGPAALRLVETSCGVDPLKWREATAAANASLEARARLWSSVETMLDASGRR